jgi:diguanylate cyclase (GGDEF)-like protein
MNDHILLVDDDPGTIQLLSRILAGLADVQFATNGADALRLARNSPPDLVLLDAEMPGMTGLQVCEAFKADPALADVAVIFVTKHHEPAFEVTGFELGAVDFIAKPVTAELVLARVKAQLRVKHLADELRRIATLDVLTGLINRGRFNELLDREWRRTRRSGDPLSLLMIDVDHFKLFNDHYGHPAGDTCLQSVAQGLLAATVRPGDMVARYGGEEFVVLLPHTSRSGAEHVARRVLDAVAALDIAHGASPSGPRVSVSVGAACYDKDSASWRPPSGHSGHSGISDDVGVHSAPMDLVRAADKAMYCAKHAGRGRAWLLDITAVETPALAREIAPPSSAV